jgi:hypothetical protein
MLKDHVVLTVTSLLSLILFSIHVTDDIVRGMDSWGPQSLIAVLILTVWLYGILVLPERRAGLAIMLIGGSFAAAMPVIHMQGNSAQSSGAFLFIWTLFALGATGTFSAILAARELRRRRPRTVAPDLAGAMIAAE